MIEGRLRLFAGRVRLTPDDVAVLLSLIGEAYREGVRDGMANALTSLERLKGEKAAHQDTLRLALSRVRESCSNATPRHDVEHGSGI